MGIEICVLVLMIVWKHCTWIGISTDTSLTEGSQDTSTMYEARVDIQKVESVHSGTVQPHQDHL